MNPEKSKRASLDRPEEFISLIHSPFHPAEIYSGEKVEAEVQQITDGGEQKWHRMSVWRLSPLGVELLLPTSANGKTVNWETHSKVNLKIQIANQECSFTGVTISSKHQQDGRWLVGIRWFEQGSRKNGHLDTENVHVLNRRSSERWICGTQFMPTGIAPNPGRFNDFIHFRVSNISTGGMLLLTSLRNRYLIPGMKLDSSISFPMCSQLSIKLRIMHARPILHEGKEQLALGVRILDSDPMILGTIGQYVFQFGPKTSIDSLKRAGLHVPNASKGVEFGFVRNENEYKEVLKLRWEAYSKAGKLAAETQPEQCGDLFDTRARILFARYRGEVVGSLRLMFHTPDDPYEIEEHVTVPNDFPRKDEVVEVTRVCTHPGFRESDLFYVMMKHLILTVAQARRRWIVGFATPKLMPLYQKIGARRTKLTFAHKGLGGLEHEVILWDVARALTGEGVNPIVWNALFSDITSFIHDRDIVEFDPMMNIRMGFYRMFKPITPFFMERVRKSKR